MFKETKSLFYKLLITIIMKEKQKNRRAEQKAIENMAVVCEKMISRSLRQIEMQDE